jgi:hypothetical protein
MIRLGLCFAFVAGILNATRYTHWEGFLWACVAVLSLWFLTRRASAAQDGTEVDR